MPDGELITNENSLHIAVDTLLDVLGVPTEDTYREQMIVFCAAVRKNAERERTYRGLWQQDSIAEIAEIASHKAKRMVRHQHNMAGPFAGDDPGKPERSTAEVEEEHEQQIYTAAMDDAIDLVNYGAFTARLVDASSIANRQKPAVP